MGRVTIFRGRVARSRYVLWKAGVVIPPGSDVHHKDRDKLNDTLDNLEVLPKGHHTREHHVGKVVSAETREKLAAHKRSRVVSDATREKIGRISRERWRLWKETGAPQYDKAREDRRRSSTGRVVSAETRAKLAESARNQLITTETRAKLSENIRNRARDWHGRLV